MKVSTFILSFCGLCVLYICNADWIDELIENYLVRDEEIAPFVSSVTAGTEEFDQMVEERSRSKRKWLLPFVLALTMVVSFLSLSIMLQCHAAQSLHGRGALESALKFLSNLKKSGTDKEEIQNIVTEFLEKKLKQLGSKQPEDIPVKLLWKGGNLVESSIHCSIKDESKLQHVQRHLLHSKLLFDSGNQMGDKIVLAPSCSETSTARKIAEIRKMLESEQELERLAEEGAEACGRAEGIRGRRGLPKRAQALTVEYDIPEEVEDYGRSSSDRMGSLREEVREKKMGQGGGGGHKKVEEANLESDPDFEPDPKLMNRIRLLESRLRLEELKNKNWINRMSKAEGILQKLNKQVEQIEESRPMGTLTETLKITSTVWSPSAHPRRNMRFTLVNQYPSCCARTPYTSLSELIKKEVGLPSPSLCSKNPFELPPTPHLPALPSPIVMPQSSILGKFLCR